MKKLGQIVQRSVGVICLSLLLGAKPQGRPVSDAEKAVQTHLGIFVTTPDRREESERVVVNQKRLEIWFLRDFDAAQRSKIVCEGLIWLLAGRLERSTGIRALFEAAPQVNDVTLVFYRAETRVEPTESGAYRQFRNAAPKARFSITRGKAMSLNPDMIRSALKGASCETNGTMMVDTVWVP